MTLKLNNIIWDKVFKNGPSKSCGRQPLKIWRDMVKFLKAVFRKVYRGPFLNTWTDLVVPLDEYAFLSQPVKLWWGSMFLFFEGSLENILILFLCSPVNLNYYQKALHLGCCSSPRSASAVAIWVVQKIHVFFQ